MGVVVRGCIAQRSNVKRLGTATLHRCFALDAMDTMNFWRSENGVYGLVVVVRRCCGVIVVVVFIVVV